MRKNLAALLVAVLAAVGVLTLAGSASAAPKAQTATIPVSGTYTDPATGASGPVTGTFAPTKAHRQGQGAVVDGVLTMVTPKGTASKHVSMPVGSVPAATPAPAAATAPAAAAPAAVTPQAVCPVLNLTLGPLHLNLLGLVIDLNQVVLNLTANPAGGLLGSLLCSLAGGPTGGPLAGLLTQLTGLLNQILGALGGATV